MAKLIATIKAILTRLIFGAHAFVAIWQVTQLKKNPFYWYLSVPMLLLFFEGVFTLTIKENQEWKWFCPSVFLYLGSVVPAIWLLELDKVDQGRKIQDLTFNLTGATDLKELNNLLGVQIKLPDIPLTNDMWVTLIEQFLMLILIIGRWMLPKGELTRDQLSQLLLVYIGTAADIIEFFDSFKDEKISSELTLVILTLAIWSWSLMQFTVVLTATKSRKSRLSASGTPAKSTHSCCCNIDVWGIALNITLQDAPFLVFRLLIIVHFNIISYMNVFFTCKNTLVIMLQLYRLYVVHSESKKKPMTSAGGDDFELTSISIISKPDMYGKRISEKKRTHSVRKSAVCDKNLGQFQTFADESEYTSGQDEMMEYEAKKHRKLRKLQNTRKDTGYSTGSSHTSCTRTPLSADEKRYHGVSKVKHNSREAKLRRSLESDPDTPNMRRQRDKQYRRMKKDVEALSEENMSENHSEMEEKKAKVKKIKNKKELEEAKLKMKMSGKKKEILELSSSDGSSE